MNIGILTYHCVPNFGAQLQALSTVGCIKNLGHTPYILNWYPEDLEKMYIGRIPSEQIACHQQFTESNLPITELCRTEAELIKIISDKKIDLIITGSDALFKYVPKFKRQFFSIKKCKYVTQKVISCENFPNNPFFCDYYELLEKKIPIVALSVSSQNCPYQVMNNEERTIIGNSLRHFKKITVRDEWTKEMVKSLTNISDIKITPDPVFAFNNNCPIHIPTKDEIQLKYLLPEQYILFSFSHKYLKDNYIKEIIKICKDHNICPVALPMPEYLRDFDLEKKISLPLSPIDWYALIRHSSGYIGERMHPIVVCLHNSVPFYSFDEYGIVERYLGGIIKKQNAQSSKTYHIVNKFGFLDNLHSIKSGKELPLPKKIIEKILSFERKKCEYIAQQTSHEFINCIKELINIQL